MVGSHVVTGIARLGPGGRHCPRRAASRPCAGNSREPRAGRCAQRRQDASDRGSALATSRWAWRPCVLPALLMARAGGVHVIVNYRGGNADSVFAKAPSHVLKLLAGASLRVTPSTYLLRVFRKHGLDAEVIPNIIDLARFRPAGLREPGDAPHLIVSRNVVQMYD